MYYIVVRFAKDYLFRNYFTFIIFLFFFNGQLFSQKKTASLTSSQAVQDIEWLERFIKDVHISPHLLYPEGEFSAGFEALKMKFSTKENISRYSLYAQLLPVYHKMKDIHLSLFLPRKVNDFIHEENYILDLNIKISENGLFVMNKNLKEIPYGAKVVKINGYADTLIILRLRAVVPSEGDNIRTRDRLVERSFSEIFPLLFQVGNKNVVEFIAPGANENQNAVISAIIAGNYKRQSKPHEVRKNYHELLSFPSVNTAYINIPSFSEGTSQEYSEYLSFVFHYLDHNNIENLIIDLRNNEGGYALRGEMLLSYLIPADIPYISNIIFKKSKMADEILDKISRNNPFIRNMIELDELKKMKYSSFGTYDTVYYNNIKPNGLVFNGKLYVLMNALSVSTTGLVCNSLRQHRGALFIGEPGGFTPQGTFGQVIRFTLPNSGISGYMSTIRFNSTNDFIIDTIPFMPDIIVEETMEDILKGNDPVLEKTMEIIRRKMD